MAQACDHSLPQLELLANARHRQRASQGLLDLSVAVAAVAAGMSKNGNAIVRKVQRQLEKESEP